MILRVEGIFFISCIIDFLLITACNKLCGGPFYCVRFIVGAVIGGGYVTMCMIPSMAFLAQPLYRIISFLVITMLAFGFSISAMRMAAVYAILSMAICGLSFILDGGNAITILISALCIVGLCYIGFTPHSRIRRYVMVEICQNSKCVKMQALCDSGNLLKDPISGSPVLIVGRDIGEKLTGLSVEQLRNPVETLSKSSIAGLRLIPYKTVGQSGGMLLGLYFPTVTVGKVKGGRLVAFSPEILSHDSTFQALIGGDC